MYSRLFAALERIGEILTLSKSFSARVLFAKCKKFKDTYLFFTLSYFDPVYRRPKRSEWGFFNMQVGSLKDRIHAVFSPERSEAQNKNGELSHGHTSSAGVLGRWFLHLGQQYFDTFVEKILTPSVRGRSRIYCFRWRRRCVMRWHMCFGNSGLRRRSGVGSGIDWRKRRSRGGIGGIRRGSRGIHGRSDSLGVFRI
jgi:hypothetical protein